MDSTENLGHTDTKRIWLKGVAAPPDLSDIKDLKTDSDSVSFLYGGSMELLLPALAALHPADVTITEPDLEEIFMHYYAEEEH